MAHPEIKLSEKEAILLHDLTARREAGEPIAYLTGKRGFWKHDFVVTPATLIPRPETELIIETTLALFDTAKPLRILDLGTGSGAIAISLALESHHWQVIATDQSLDALAIARENAIVLQARNVSFIESDWFSDLQGQFDLIVSNPPYVVQEDPHLNEGDLRFEPLSALASGKEGLDAIENILFHAPKFLNPFGTLMIEHGYDQERMVQAMFEYVGFKKVRTLRDLQNWPRITLGSLADTES